MFGLLSRPQLVAALGAGLALGVVIVWSGIWRSGADAWEASGDKFRVLALPNGSSDRFYNYDNTTKDHLPPHSDEVDNALTLVFTGAATSVKIRNKLTSNGYPDEGGQEHQRLKDEAAWAWDSDRGRKGIDDCDNYHIRIYADPYGDGLSYDAAWGYYVLASTHYDHQECFPWTEQEFGWGDASQDVFENFFDGFSGWDVFHDTQNFYNNEPARWDCETPPFRCHYWLNDNLASQIEVP